MVHHSAHPDDKLRHVMTKTGMAILRMGKRV